MKAPTLATLLLGPVVLALIGQPLGAAPAKLPNSVTCVYDALSPEQREIAQYLIIESLDSGDDPLGDKGKAKELHALLKDGSNACIDIYPWSVGKTEYSIAFAASSLLLDAMHPAMEEAKVSFPEIDSYLALNKPVPGPKGPTKTMDDALIRYLTAKNLEPKEERQRNLSIGYYRTQLMRDALRRGFAANVMYRR